MRAPRLNRHLVLEAPARVADGSGGYAVTWQTLGSLWAEVTARTGRETASVAAPVSAVSYKILVRGAPLEAPNRPKPDQRFREGSRLFHIVAVADGDADGRYLACYANEETVV